MQFYVHWPTPTDRWCCRGLHLTSLPVSREEALTSHDERTCCFIDLVVSHSRCLGKKSYSLEVFLLVRFFHTWSIQASVHRKLWYENNTNVTSEVNFASSTISLNHAVKPDGSIFPCALFVVSHLKHLCKRF